MSQKGDWPAVLKAQLRVNSLGLKILFMSLWVRRRRVLRKQNSKLLARTFNLSTQNDFILDCFGEMHKVCAIACHSYQKIPMQFGVLLCIDQRLPVDDIELNVLAAPIEIGFYQRRKLLQVPCAF